MKTLIFVVLFICQGWAISPEVYTERQVGAKQCTWGPSYWCSNLTAAAGCNAVKHCIQTVWEHQQLPRDTDSVCQTCLKMVKEARDQLLSNETEGEIEDVFEGSCKLIPIKIVSKECCKLVDDFIPELIDTLASQMNPQVVCSVAGLCNSARVDGLIEEFESEADAPREPANTCEGCQTVITILEHRFQSMSKESVLQSFLQICGHMGSLSDACSNIIVTYFPEIYEHLDKNFNPNDVCLMTGECSAKFHTHSANVEITPLSKVGFVPVDAKDDLPCELCEQLVTHLRELLIANTTENEFQRVLEGLCKQTKNFKDECLSIVDQYYGTIYNFLVSELNSTVACSMIGICPPSNVANQNVPIVPLLPVESAPKALELMNNNKASNEGSAIEIAAKPETMQLPIERIFVPHLQETYNKQVCVFCEYFLHYLQQAITTPKTVDEIKHFVDKACEKFPSSINETCINFVDTYGDAVVALLAQEIDPSTICPLIRACPSSDAKNVEVFAEGSGNKQNCPMCLFAVTELEEMVKNDKTKNNIKNALGKLCSHLSDKIAIECQDFVNTYTDTLVELMIADLTPQEVCVFLKLCDDKMPAKPIIVVAEEIEDHDLLTNEIPDFTVNGQYIIDVPSKPRGNKPQCVICEFAMTKIQSLLENKTTEEEIKQAVVNICSHLPKSVRGECTTFVNKYADLVIQLLIGAMEPDEICAYLGLCDKKPRISKVVPMENAELMQIENVGSPQCVICKLVMSQIEKYVIGTTTKDEIISALYGVCAILPRHEEDSCNNFVRQHGDQIADLILMATAPSEICSLMFLCKNQQELLEHEIQQCALCQAAYFNYIFLSDLKEDVTVRNICAPMTQDYKMECYKMFKLNKRRILGHFGEVDSGGACIKLNYCQGEMQYLRLRRDLVGSNKCTWGPSYWCASASNAEGCGQGAVEHCNKKGWATSRKRRQVLVGSNKCTWGPSYWCANPTNAQECGEGAVDHCTRNNWNVSRKRRQLVGAEKCTWGPGYWCASMANAQECEAVEHCTRNNWNVSRKRRQVLGAEKCTWGPGYWCASTANAQECDAVEHCTKKGWNVSRKRRQVGSNKCSWGPSYWCASKSNAARCGTEEHCEKSGWNVSRKRREVLVGSNKCTWGPAYWCASASNAQECGPEAVEHCRTIRKRRETLLGSKHCTWGPSYWCSNLANAQECNAVDHCHNKVWKGSAPSS